MVKPVSDLLSRVVHRWLPDPLIFALAITAVIFACGVALTPHDAVEMVRFWGDGFWGLLAFAMQMALVLVTGHALASSPAMARLMAWAASRARNPRQAVVLVTVISAAASLVNWGFGLVLGAMFAREVARRVRGCDYALLIAAGYIGFMVWHGGLSGSVPLVAATKGNPMEKTIGLIAISDTLATSFNLFITGALLLALPLITWSMLPKPGEAREIDPALLGAEPSAGRPIEAGAVPSPIWRSTPAAASSSTSTRSISSCSPPGCCSMVRRWPMRARFRPGRGRPAASSCNTRSMRESRRCSIIRAWAAC
jgi:short-chain fatty acids transporter